MKLTVEEAMELTTKALVRHGMTPTHAAATADHLVDTALRGDEFAGVSRVLAIVEELRKRGRPEPIRVVRESAVSALIDGGDNIAYVVSTMAMEMAITKCREAGVGIVGANNTWYGGRLGYYVEQAAREGYIAIHANNAIARVAPYGSIDRILGTNPLAVAFPAVGDPLVLDIGTSATSSGDVVLSRAKGESLPGGVAIDSAGRPTSDPDAALKGAFLAWGGHRGSGLAMAIQVLGILVGSDVRIDEVRNYGLFFLVLDPQLFGPRERLSSRIEELRALVHASRPAQGVEEVRMPGEGSAARRRRALEQGTIEVDDRVYEKIRALCA